MRAVIAMFLVLILLVVVQLVHAAEPIASPQTCSTDEEKQFTVTITTDEPLGLRLSETLHVLEFVADAQGRSRAVEATGLAEIGDRLVQVNDEVVKGRILVDAVAVLRDASLPKVLRFQTHDGRCQVPMATTTVDARRLAEEEGEEDDENDRTKSEPTEAALPATYDYALLSVGEKETECTYYGVLSADGKPPSCEFRRVAITFPFDACSPLETNATDKYVLVPTISGCPLHQKATFAQDAGAKSVIFLQYEGGKPQQIKVPRDLPKPLLLPLVMVTMDSGMQIVDQIAKVHPTQTLQLRFVFSAECASAKYEVHPQEDPHMRSVHARTQSAVSGFLSISTATSGTAMEANGAATAYEFLKPGDARIRISLCSQLSTCRFHALRHHWSDLAELADPRNWPSSEVGRDRLFHRILKDHDIVLD
ncbi:hypothetical protein FI667_g2213, partial [Globisporangium splendens]